MDFLRRQETKKLKKYKRFQNPKTKDALSILLSRLILFWSNRLSKGSHHTTFFFDEYDKRFYFIASLPDRNSETIRKLIEKKVLRDEEDAFRAILGPGIAYVEKIRDYMESNPQVFFTGKTGIISWTASRFNPETNKLTPLKLNIKETGKMKLQVEILPETQAKVAGP